MPKSQSETSEEKEEKLEKELPKSQSETKLNKKNTPQSPFALYPDENNTDEEYKVQMLPINLLYDYKKNTFSKRSDEEYEVFKETIKEQGVLQPLIVRRKIGGYEIVSGHNRKRALADLGINKAPCIVKDISDEEASIQLVVSNDQRKEVSDIELGRGYRNAYEEHKKSIGRPKTEKMSQSETINLEEEKISKNETLERTDQYLAKRFGVSARTFPFFIITPPI